MQIVEKIHQGCCRAKRCCTFVSKCRSQKHGHAQTRITDGALKYKLSKIRLGFDKDEKLSRSVSNIQHEAACSLVHEKMKLLVNDIAIRTL